MNQYEAMFLFDPTFGSSFEKCEAEVQRLMDRAEGEVLFCRKWDERRLAYRIDGRKRGVYALVYFKAAAEKIAPLERDVKLSEDILRVLVLRTDGLDLADMEKAFANRGGESSGGRHEGRGPSQRPAGKDAPKDAPKDATKDAPKDAEPGSEQKPTPAVAAPEATPHDKKLEAPAESSATAVVDPPDTEEKETT